MKKKVLKFQDFQNETLSKKQLIIVRGGDGDGDTKEPGKGGGGNGNNVEEEAQRIFLPIIICHS